MTARRTQVPDDASLTGGEHSILVLETRDSFNGKSSEHKDEDVLESESSDVVPSLPAFRSKASSGYSVTLV